MMKWLRALIVVALCAVPVGANAWWQSIQQVGVSAGTSYSGPGDVVSGAIGFYSCRAYNLAKAGTKAYRIVRASDSTQTDINSLANGLCDTSTPATFCNATTCKYVTFYDQSGALACSGGTACDISQAGDASRPPVSLAALNGWPCATSAISNMFMNSGNLSAAQAQPVTYIALAERTANFTTIQRIFSQTAVDVPRISFNSVASQFAMNAGTGVTVTASDSAFHVMQAVFNGASSIAVIDGSATTGLNAGTTGLTTNGLIFGNNGTSLNGGIACELAVYPIGLNATQYGNINTNLHSAAFGWNF